MDKLLPTFLRIVGVFLLIVGLVGAYYAPLEIYVLYLFSEGGRFHYDGFGVGSFWFATLVVMNLGYYLIAAVCLPLAVGHIRLRCWSLTLAQLYTWFWLGAGILLVANSILLLPSVFRLDLERGIIITRVILVGVSSLIALVFLPLLGLWFYKSDKVRSVFVAHDPNLYWTERYPFPLLAVLLLFIISIIVLHIAMFFQAMFPMFGRILLGRQSVYIIAMCILISLILIYGIVQLKTLAWWGSLVYVSLLTISTVMSFAGYSFYDVVEIMKLPAYEMELIDKMALIHDYPLVGLALPPLLIAFGLIIYSKRYFGKDNRLQIAAEVNGRTI